MNEKMNDILARIEVLEHHNRRWKRLCGTCALCLLLVLSYGAASFTENLVIRDNRDQAAIIIGADVDPQTQRSIIIADRNGVNRIAIGIAGNGQTYCNFFDSSGNLQRNLAP